jgi:hypothetical protein
MVPVAVALWLIAATAPPSPAFVREIQPILANNCYRCHGPDARTRAASLRLDTADGVARVFRGRSAPGLARILSDDPARRMPPPASGLALTAAQRRAVTQWAGAGSPWQSHWAFVPPVRPLPPPVPGARTDIDAFIRARLAQRGLSPSPPADPATLLRRVTMDLTGLPPTDDERRAFLADRSPAAYEAAVDRLLASPRFGERMAWDWLDAARYADTNGFQEDRTRPMWPWRDWVVGAFNANLPYDQFVVQQFAGDLLANATVQTRLATGFHRNHMLNGEGGRLPEESRVDSVFDRTETTGTVVLGLTIGCARCHDHKFDPISQKDYYGLYAFFNSIDETGAVDHDGAANPVLALTPPGETAPLDVMVLADRKAPRSTAVLVRGAYDHPGDAVTTAFPAVLGGGAPSPSNRLDLARWLVSPRNPLTARVAVNRLWQLCFGTGLVRTAEDFGVQGERPSHPELLDWLATEFVASGWDTKRLLKTIVLSQTYRQSSRTAAAARERDPANRWLARFPRQRWPSWMLRDQALAVAGLLVERRGGPPVKPYQPDGVWEDFSYGKITYAQDHGAALWRRSLYTFWRRSAAPPVFFDAAGRRVCTVRLEATNTPLHALTVLNDTTYVEAARVLADRAFANAARFPDDRLRWAFQAVTARAPTPAERGVLTRAYQRQRAAYAADPTAAERLLAVGEAPRAHATDSVDHATLAVVCLTLLNLDEFLSKE